MDYIVMLLQQSKENVSIVNTCNTYFVLYWSVWFIWEFLVNVLIQYMLWGSVNGSILSSGYSPF